MTRPTPRTCRHRTPAFPPGATLVWAAAFAGAMAATTDGAIPTAEETAFFEEKVRPLLVERCYKCHAADTEQKGGLVLDNRAGWAVGGDTGPALVAGDPDASLIMRAVGYEEPDLQMPPKERLSDGEIADLRTWIEAGAPDPREGGPAYVDPDAFDLGERVAAHWAWRPRGEPTPPETSERGWPAGDIDRFILSKLEEAGLEPSPPADRRTLVRRLYFDLVGLPPTPGEVEAFLEDDAPGAVGRLVDDLLASAHFGEKWGQHWLDLVRFAETRGHEQDFPIPQAWKYRDYVIRAINADVPYDQFLVEHIAGDLVAPPRTDPERQTNESIQGTGFWHLGEATHSPVDIRDDECARVANQIDVFSKAFLSLTVSCARCHDHKFDAVTTHDYYALAGYLQSSGYHLADASDPAAQAEAAAQLEGLARETRSELIEALTNDFEANRRGFARTLSAGREAMATLTAAQRGNKGGGDDLQVDRQALAKVAAKHGVPAGRLEAAARALHDRRDDGDHPLHLIAGHRDEPDPARAAVRVLESWQRAAHDPGRTGWPAEIVRTDKKGELDRTESRRPFDPERDVIANYAELDPEDWITTGHRFGAAPGDAGQLWLSADTNKPMPRITAEPAAHSDLASGRLTGMLRTKTFEVTGDTVWLRVRGEADLFVAVDSHRVCEGPLHSNGLKAHLNAGDRFRWVSHDLHKYIGHRAHLEFSPAPDGDFAVSRIAFGAEAPPRDRINSTLPNLADVSRVANGPAGLLVDAMADAIEAVSNATCPLCANRDELELADVALQLHPLWAPDGSASRQLVAKVLEKKRSLENRIPRPERVLALVDGSPEDEPVHIRGNYRTLSPDAVPRRFLEALGRTENPTPTTGDDHTRGSGRLALAHEVASAENPLTARVMVNRVWHHLFGRGIVPTVDNFGATGQPPSHPELLDYLANGFVENGWSLKQAVRQIVLSSTYQQSSAPDPAKTAADPTNQLLHRMPVRRLTGEAVRDNLLAVSGRLERTHYGPSVRVHITEFMRTDRSPKESGPLDGDGRRSIYIEGRRNHLEPLLLAFDKPTPFTAIGQRNVSNSPAQPLIMLNNPLVHDQARLWAESLLANAPDDAARIDLAYRTAFARHPEPWEREAALAFLKTQAAAHGEQAPGPASWADLTHTLFNVKEFIFLN